MLALFCILGHTQYSLCGYAGLQGCLNSWGVQGNVHGVILKSLQGNSMCCIQVRRSSEARCSWFVGRECGFRELEGGVRAGGWCEREGGRDANMRAKRLSMTGLWAQLKLSGSAFTGRLSGRSGAGLCLCMQGSLPTMMHTSVCEAI